MMAMIGMRMIESVWMTKPETRTVQRTWRERLWSWPWRPWQPTKLVTVQVPSPEVLRMGDTLIAHPQTIKAIQQLLSEGR